MRTQRFFKFLNGALVARAFASQLACHFGTEVGSTASYPGHPPQAHTHVL